MVVIKALSSKTLQERHGINRQDVEVSKLNYNPTSLNLILNSQLGLQIRTSGDLGAQDEIYLNGLKGDQIRILLNGKPLKNKVFKQDINALPVSQIKTIEIYKGVTLIEYGVDTIGEVINIITHDKTIKKLGVSLWCPFPTKHTWGSTIWIGTR